MNAPDSFQNRHIGPRPADRDAMLKAIGLPSFDALIDEAIPSSIRLRKPLQLPDAESEHEFLQRLRAIAAKNRVLRSYIGMGYYDSVTPAVILRNVLENPGWYTPYTPYQAELAQGRLESLLNFQTMVTDLTGMPIATASLLDEGTAAAEAMAMLHRLQPRGRERHTFLVSSRTFPQTIDVVVGRAEPMGIEVRLVDPANVEFDLGAGARSGESAKAADSVFGLLLQYPDDEGRVEDLRGIISRAHEKGVQVAVATDLLALAILTPPGEMGADVVVGNSQRFGVPMGYGGPHAAFFATRQENARQAPGRIIGVSIDAHGNRAYRMALQTREQHIRREKATSNICTAQALLANIAAMYAVYHGPEGIKAIARQVHLLARVLDKALQGKGFTQTNRAYFDTLCLKVAPEQEERIREASVRAGMNFRHFGDGRIGISLDETTSWIDLTQIVEVFTGVSESAHAAVIVGNADDTGLPASITRTSPFLAHPVFNSYHSETAMMRYIRGLERRDVGLDTSMIPLGSCTMKLNAAAEMLPITWPEFAKLHPFVPVEQAEGYQQIFRELESALSEITGLPAVSLQPNSGAQGELTGLRVIRAYHHDRGQQQRDVVLIPSSAHGTNPASAVMAGMRVVVVASTREGHIDVDDLRKRAEEHQERLAALMVTYPSTHGVFEERIMEICRIVHANGGQVYMDGANMNAQVGLTSPAAIGADVCHLNLHKTFAIPHGGGGPGMGPIACAAHLAPYLPGHAVVSAFSEGAASAFRLQAEHGRPAVAPAQSTGDIGAKAGRRTEANTHIRAVAAAPWGSADILLISYGYIRMLGAKGMTEATRYAILNANYICARLAGHYGVLYTNEKGRVAHEMIFDLRPFKMGQGATIDELDVAKRLMDYGFHAPTVSFPVPGTMMVEPTESEPREELDRFCDALIAIRKEIQAVLDGKADPKDNVLKNAPHTAAEATADDWSHPYSREQAVFPLPWVRAKKIWPAVGRIDNPYGDRNLMCSCPPVETFAEV